MVDVYAEKVLKALGLPTAIRKPEEIDYFTLLGVSQMEEFDEAIAQAAVTQNRKLREFQQKGDTATFANRLEQLIIKARSTLGTAEGRARYKASMGGGPVKMAPAAAPTTGPSQAQIAKEHRKFDRRVVKRRGLRKLITAVVVVIIVYALAKYTGVWEQATTWIQNLRQ